MKRLYEWRDAKGNRAGPPVLAENACAFRMASMVSGSTSEPSLAGEKVKNPVYAFVTATGERVNTELAKNGTAVRLDQDMPWFNADGRQVKP